MSMPPKPPGYYTDKLFTCDDMDKAIQKEREECAKICSEFPDVGYVKAILTCDYHSYLINKRGTKMSAIPISQMANDILKIIEEVALDYPEEREELKAVMLGQLGLAMFNRPMGDKNELR